MHSLAIGIVGLDNWYHGLPFAELAATTPGVSLVAVSDGDPRRRAWIAERYPSVRAVDDHASVLDDPSIDAVIVMSTTAEHADHAVAAARAGKHLLCDKPLGLGVAAARRIVEAYAAPGLRAATIFGRRARPLFREAKRIIDEGQIGTVLCAFETGRFGLPRAEAGSADPGWLRRSGAQRGRGLPRPRSASGRHVPRAPRLGSHASPRHAREASPQGARGRGLRDRHAELRQRRRRHHRKLVDRIGPSTAMIYIEGTAGSIRWDDAAKTLTLANGQGRRTLEDQPGRFLEGPGWRLGMTGYADVFRNFVDCIRHDASPIASLADGLRAVEVTDAIYGRSG